MDLRGYIGEFAGLIVAAAPCFRVLRYAEKGTH